MANQSPNNVTFEHEDFLYHYKVNLTQNESLYNTKCYLNVGLGWYPNDTIFVYSETQSVLTGICAAVIGVLGAVLNSIIIVALIKNSNIRKEDFTPFILSLALSDLLFCVLVLPFNAARFFQR